MSQESGKVISVLKRLRARQEWQFFAVLPKADPRLATVWWVLLMLNGAMPAIFAVAIGVIVGAVQQARPVGGPLALTGLVFVLMLLGVSVVALGWRAVGLQVLDRKFLQDQGEARHLRAGLSRPRRAAFADSARQVSWTLIG